MYYLGVDLGGTNIAIGLVGEDGNIIKKVGTPTLRHRAIEEIFEDIAGLCKKMIADEGLTEADIASIGIGSPGTPDPKNGVIVYASNLNFDNTPVREMIKKHINVPVYVENDANCASLGEVIAGAAKGYKNSITVTLGTGLGGGIVVDGKIFSGSFYGGGEVGHHVIVVDGEECTCGRRGCWEVYSSATGLIREARIAAARHPDSGLFKLVGGDIRLIDAKTPFDAAAEGDAIGRELVDRYVRYLAEGLANMINILQPDVVVIGGGVCAQGDTLLIPLTEEVHKRVYGIEKNRTKIVIAKLGNDAGIIGAAMLCTQNQ